MNIPNFLTGLTLVFTLGLIVMFGRSYSTTLYRQQSASNLALVACSGRGCKNVSTTATTTYATNTLNQPSSKPKSKSTTAKTVSKVIEIAKSIVRTKMPTGMKWGVYTGWHDISMSYFETITGKKPNMEMVFVHWGNETVFPSYYAPRIRDKGRTMVLFWEPSDYKRDPFDQAEFSYDKVIAGELDSYFMKFADGARVYGGEIIIIPYSEFNGNWYSWGGTIGNNSPQKHIDAYRHIYDFFRDVPNVKFGWAPNAGSVPNIPSNQFELYYPGDDYVDYVGVDGFNFGGTHNQTFGELFNNTIERLKKYKKPIYIFSFATADSPDKAQWIKDAMTIELYKHPEIKGWLWFNQNKEADWRIDSNPKSLKAFIDVLP